MLRRAQLIRTERGTLHRTIHQSEPLCGAASLSAVWDCMPVAGGAPGATVRARTSAHETLARVPCLATVQISSFGSRLKTGPPVSANRSTSGTTSEGVGIASISRRSRCALRV